MRILCLLLLLPASLFPQAGSVSQQMKMLADAERSFAAESVRSGIRASFFQYFADDGIAFQPGPVIYKEAVRDRSAPEDPKAHTLDWKPIFGDVASSGDLGYTTGPYVLIDNTGNSGPPSHGFYFSVWKKQDDGSWKVALDIGVPTPPSSDDPAEFSQASSGHFVPRSRTPPRELLIEAERLFSRHAASEGMMSARKKFFHRESRMHRPGTRPIIGKPAILRSAMRDSSQYRFDAQFAEASLSGNLGYTYGRYEESTEDGHGYFARVWKLDESGGWKIVADIASPVSGNQDP